MGNKTSHSIICELSTCEECGIDILKIISIPKNNPICNYCNICDRFLGMPVVQGFNYSGKSGESKKTR